MKYIFIINNFSGTKKDNSIIDKIEKYCNNNNIDFVIENNDELNSTEDILLKYKNNNNIIFAVGGDGMINRVLNGIVNTNNILSFIPYGTGNDLYKSIKLQMNNGINDCDLVKINDLYFINVACFGIDADVGNNKNIIKSNILPKNLRYSISLLTTFFKYHNKEFELIVNDKHYNNRFATIAICNGIYYGGGFKIGFDSLLNDNYIDVYFVENINKLSLIKLLLMMKKECLQKSSLVNMVKTDEVIIKSKNVVCANIDGELLESNEFKIKLLKEKIKIYYNQDMIDYITKKR